jgi:ribosomal protein S18 acetylase RimI-like enzyme
MADDAGRTRLRPMDAAAFAAWQGAAIAHFAADNVDAGRWPAEGALARAQQEFAALLPLGLATPDQHLFEIVDGADGTGDGDPTHGPDGHPPGGRVGWLWAALERRAGPGSLFVYDLEIAAAQRRRGHARRALRQLEALARGLGAADIGLHVFASNAGAQALYRALGFQVTGLNMNKALGPA